MQEKSPIDKIRSELQESTRLAKCKKCGCLKETLKSLQSTLPMLQTQESADLLRNVESWLEQMEQSEYSCLGCKHCFPAVATNIFNQAFPKAAKQASALSCDFEVHVDTWPPVPGEYIVLCNDPSCSVAVSTLASSELAEKLASIKPKKLSIVGKTETENIGIDKIIKNTITNPNIHFLILSGNDPDGHCSGKTVVALSKNGVDENMKVIGSPGMNPVLKNVTREEVEMFRNQVQLVDMIECTDEAEIVNKIKNLHAKLGQKCTCEECATERIKSVQISTVSVIEAKETLKVQMDKTGYFVIIPQPKKRSITVEHYSFSNKLLRAIEGKDAKSICSTIIENGWVTQLSHAAYLGIELTKAEFSLKQGFKYLQDLQGNPGHS